MWISSKSAGRYAPCSTKMLLLGVLLGASTWSLAATRTWVSGVGDDVNPCSLTAPCKNLAAALAQTDAGGLISVLDAASLNAGVLAATVINKSVTIEGADGYLAAMDGVASQDTLRIDVPGGGHVTLRNLSLNGFSQGGNGIRVASAATQVLLDRVDIWGYSGSCLLVDAAAANARVELHDASLSLCATGVTNAASSAQVHIGGETMVSLHTAQSVQQLAAPGSVRVDGGAWVEQQVSTTTQVNQPMQGIGSFIVGSNVSLVNASPGCSIATQQFLTPSAAPAQLPARATQVAAAGVDFITSVCGAGETVTVTVTYSEALPVNTQLFKYVAASNRWLQVAGAQISADRMQITYLLQDNGPLDEDATAGVMHDPVWPLVVLPAAAGATVAVPTLSHAATALLAVLLAMGALVLRTQRRRVRT